MTFPSIARVRRRYQQPIGRRRRGRHQAMPSAMQPAGRRGWRPAAGWRSPPAAAGFAASARSWALPLAAVRSLGFDPFVVAAMGSHGGGTAAGQAALLAELGVTEAAVGCPIRSTHGNRRARNQLVRAADPSRPRTPSRPMASSCSTGSSRTPRSPAGTRAGCSRCSPIGLGQAPGGRPGPQAGPARALQA